MIDLTTRYLGLALKNPLVCAASTLGRDLDNLQRMEDAGAAAVVLPSLFEEQIELAGVDPERCRLLGPELGAWATGDFPDMNSYNTGPDGYVDLVRRAKTRLGIPVIGSLNGITPGGWMRYATLIESAGADALELNVYDLPTDPAESAMDVEDRLVSLVRDVCQLVRIPVAVKLSPYLTAPAHLARRLASGGADGLVLFNRFSQPERDWAQLGIMPRLRLSGPDELPLRLHWVAIVFGQVGADLAVTGGVDSARDIVKVVMAGGVVAQVASALYKHGIDHLAQVLTDLRRWLETHEYASLKQVHGSMSLLNLADSKASQRANYAKLLQAEARWATR